MTYDELYYFLKDSLETIYGVVIPDLPQLETNKATVKTYADYAPGSKCDWGDQIVPIYIPKEWEKDPTQGLIVGEE